jgi:hypothetical protein
MNSKNIQNLIFGTPRIYLIFLFCVGLTHAQRVDVVDHLGNKAQTGTEVEESATGPTSPKEGDIWINTNKTPNTTNIYDFDTKTWKEVKPSYQSVLQDIDGDTKIQLDKNKADNNDEDTIRFDTDAKERMVIRDDGKVGIGISKTKDEAGDIMKNPHINGELHLSKSAPDKDVCARIQNNTVSDDGDHGKHGSTATLRFSVTPNSSFDSAFVGSDRTNSLILGSNADERMRIDEFGNVGIGRVPSEFREGFHALQVGGDQGNGITLLGNDASIGTGYYLKRDRDGVPNNYLYDNPLKKATMLKMSDKEFSFKIAAKEKEEEEEEEVPDNKIEWKEIMKIENYEAPIITTTAANKNSGLRLKIVGGGNELLRIQDGNNNNLMMLDGSGNVGIGTSTPSSYALNDNDPNDPAKLLVVANISGNSTSIASGSSGTGYLAFANGTSGTSTNAGSIQYNHSTNAMSMHTTDGTERMRIDSSGLLIVQGDTMMKGMLTFTESGTAKKGICGKMANTDQWFVGGGGTGTNSGYLEISTGDDAQVGGTPGEAIYVRQYGPGSPLTGSLHRSAALLDTQGNTYFPGSVTESYSDERLKTKTGNINNALEKVQSLSGFYYVENELAKQHGYSTESQQVGLSAQEVQAVLPEAVSLAPFDRIADEVTNDSVSKSGEDYLTVDYSRLVPLLIESIKELKAELDDAKARIIQLESN